MGFDSVFLVACVGLAVYRLCSVSSVRIGKLSISGR